MFFWTLTPPESFLFSLYPCSDGCERGDVEFVWDDEARSLPLDLGLVAIPRYRFNSRISANDANVQF